jgi:TP901 family phage tail tape measure protein
VVTDLLVRINATAAGYDAAMAKAQLSTYKFDTALRQANLAVGQLEAELATAGPAAAAAAGKMAAAQTEATVAAQTKIGKSLGLMGLAGAAAFVMIAKSAAEFDSKMATVQSLIRDVSSKDMVGLRNAAMHAGEGIAVSAVGAADAEIELAKAGVSVKDIMGGALRGALVLAAAGQTDVATATQVAASAMTQFGLAGKDVPHIADLLAAGADKALGSVADLGYALAQAGTTAHQSGISIEETTGVLAEFAQAGLIGERGGTAFKTMLIRLEAPSDKAAELMKKFGLSLYDAAGNIKTMPELAANLTKSFGDLAPAQRNAALATIFGTRAVQGANIMMQAGQKITAQWIEKVNDQGFAAHQAAGKLDSLTGDLDKFKAHLSNAMVDMGEASQGPLRELIQQLDHLVSGFNGLPKPVQQTVVAIIGLTTVTGLLGGAMLLGVAKIAKLRLALVSTEVEAVALRNTMALTAASIGKSFAIIGAADFAAHMINHLNAADTSVNTLTDDLARLAHGGGLAPELSGTSIADAVIFGGQDPNKVVGQTSDLVDMISQAYEAKSKVAQISNLGFDTSETNQIQQIDAALVQLSKTDPSAAEDAFNRLVHAGNMAGLSTAHAMQMFPGFLKIWTAGYEKMRDGEQAVGAGARAMGQPLVEAGASTQILGGATDKTTASMAKEISTAKGLVAALDGLNNKNLDLRSSERDWQQSILDATTALKTNGQTLNKHTQEGLDNAAALDAMATSAIAHAAAMQKDGKGLTQVNGYLTIAHARLVTTAEDMGMGKKQAEAYADSVLKIPKTADTKATFDHKQADSDARAWKTYLHTLMSDIPDEIVNISLSARASKVEAQLGGLTGVASGGPISGPGTGTSDSIVARLSAGEHVWTAAEVTKAGGHGVVEGLRRLAMLGELPRRGDISMFGAGGPVTIDPAVKSTGLPQSTRAVDAMFDVITASLGHALSKKLNHLLTTFSFGAGSPLGLAGSLTPAGIVRGQQFAQSQRGKPYEWSAVGPNSYDCSGFQSAVLNAAHNAYPYRRLGSTASMPWAGSAPGVGMYTIGWSTNVGGSGIGHTSGNIGGLGVESNGSDGVVVGSGALSPLSSMFYGLMHYDRGGILKPGLTLAHNGTGRNEVVLAPRAPARGGYGGSRRFVLEGPMTLDVDGHQLSGVVRGIVREEVSDEFHYMSAGV